MAKIQPGRDGESLPDRIGIFRIGRNCHLNDVAKNSSKPLPEIFELSSEEKELDDPRLSVWVEELTIADQAWDFMGAKPKNTIVACLDTEMVRGVKVRDQVRALDVQWEQAYLPGENGERIKNHRPGANGHCGITGLKVGSRAAKKAIRSQLADAATVSPTRVPHPFGDDSIRPIAHHNWTLSGCDDAETNWIEAIREKRRKAAAIGRMPGTDNSIAADDSERDTSLA